MNEGDEYWVYISIDGNKYLQGIQRIVDFAKTETKNLHEFLEFCNFNLCITNPVTFILVYYYEAKKKDGKWYVEKSKEQNCLVLENAGIAIKYVDSTS